MNELSFDIKTSKDFFNKLLEDYKEFQSGDISSRVALNCAMTAWHLTEWVYNEYKPILANKFPNFSDYVKDIKQKCPSLQIMHDLANGSKHYLLTKHKSIIKDTNFHEGHLAACFQEYLIPLLSK